MSGGATISKPVDVGNRHLFFECAGQGEPVVMLESGLGDGCDAWEPTWGKLPPQTPQDSEALKELRANLVHPTITETIEGFDANALLCTSAVAAVTGQ